MIEVRQTSRFTTWLAGLRDHQARARILKRLKRVQQGNLGDVASVGEGIMEMRVFYGPGYRLYYVQEGAAIVVMLCGGDKSSQDDDIKTAKAMAKEGL